MKTYHHIVLLLFIFVFFSGCRQTEYVYIPKVQIRDSITTKTLHDSIYIKVKEYERNDTIYRDSLVYQFVFRSDTINVSVTDSIPYPVEVPKYVERELNAYQKTFIKLGWAFLIVIIGLIGYKVIKLYLKRL